MKGVVQSEARYATLAEEKLRLSRWGCFVAGLFIGAVFGMIVLGYTADVPLLAPEIEAEPWQR